MQPKKLDIDETLKAHKLKKTLGYKVAAAFLRNRGYEFAQTLRILGLPVRSEEPQGAAA